VRLVTYAAGAVSRLGAVTDVGVVDLTRELAPDIRDMHDLIAKVDLATIRSAVEQAKAIPADQVVLLKPLTRWGKCFCVGVNYPDRNAEYKDGSDRPGYPSLFVRFPESFVGPDEPILRPLESERLDYEGEVVLVIGKAGRRIPAERAMEHVFGFTVANEGSIRDWIRHGKFNVTPGKNFARSGALGPWIVPAADMPAGPLRVTTRVNGDVRQDDTTDHMLFSFAFVIEYISRFCTLEPGDLILTGTPTGAGARFDPPRYLVPGDIVEVEVSGIGVLRNTVRDEAEMG
jgi:2-keto-4-pentenoate hydratase/2-oxohepta-3-ene-1,7-dioic acid hydratase in catechol pathway